jgi:hypothetical protein
MKQEPPAFWLTNFTKRNVSLADLNLTVKAFSSVNLLDKKHYDYTLEQLIKSATQGSIFKKNNMLAVRQVAPVVIKMNVPFDRETFIPSRERSTFSIKEENYDELNVSDEEFAKENADLVVLDDKTLATKV